MHVTKCAQLPPAGTRRASILPASAYGVNVFTFSPIALRGLTVKRHWIAAVMWAACCTGTALAQTAPPDSRAEAAQATPAPPQPRTEVRAEFLPRPRLRIGRSFSIELTAKVQGDISRFDPVVDVADEDFVWRRRRLGIRGELFDRIQFEVEREFGDAEDPWRDVYVNVRGTDLIEVRAGKFKVPFGLDNSTGSTSHDFVSRSLGTRTLSPGRDLGIMAHGRADGRLFSYAVGVFDGSDDIVAEDAFFDDDDSTASADRTAAARVTAQPFDRRSDVARAIKNLEFGVSGAWSKVPEGLNGFEGRSVYRYDFFEPVYVKGSRIRAGVDAAMFAGPTSLKAEWMSAWDERLNQGLGDVDLSRAFVRGWYVAGTWLVTGEDKDEDVRPRRPFLQGGIGAIELAARYERLLLGSTADDTEPAFANPRAENLLRNRDDVTTLGLTWHLNRWFKLQGNAIRESFDDVSRAPILDEPHYWSYVGRAQFVF